MFPADGPLPAPDGIDHVVLLGAICSVYDDGPARGWIADELAWLRQADLAGLPVLRHLLRRAGARHRVRRPGRGRGR